MPKIPEDIIIIIFRYLHRNKMKLLNQEYHTKFNFYRSWGVWGNESAVLCRANGNKDNWRLLNYRDISDIKKDKDRIYHFDKNGIFHELDILFPKNY